MYRILFLCLGLGVKQEVFIRAQDVVDICFFKKNVPIFDNTIDLNPVDICYDEAGYPEAASVEKLFFKYIPLLGPIKVEESLEAGVCSGEIYRAYSSSDSFKPLFFLKMKKHHVYADEWKNLIKVQMSSIGDFNSLALNHTDMPIVVKVEAVFIVQAYNSLAEKSIKSGILVMQAAEGKSVEDIFYRGTMDELEHCAYKVGKALGLFHTHFMRYLHPTNVVSWKTVTHGDFHGGNLFFDSTHNRTYFIDNEKMADRLDREVQLGTLLSPCTEFLHAHGKEQPLNIIYFSQYINTYENLEKAAIFTVQFMRGYLDGYPEEKGKYMAKYLKKKVFDEGRVLGIKYYEKRRHLFPGWNQERLQLFIDTLNDLFAKAEQ